MRLFILLIVLGFNSITFAQNNPQFDAANALYNQSKYAEAIEKYEAILASKIHSAEVYFNLGNAHYKLNNIAPSIYYYEKALQLNPEDKDIKNNLAFAQNMTIDAIDKSPDVGFSRILKTIINTTSADNWAIIAVVSCILFVVLFLFFRLLYSTGLKRITFITGTISFLFGCFCLLMAFQKNHLDKKNKPAIVFAQESRVKTDPNKASEEVFRLHEGTKIQVLETFENWYKIQLSDNATGWMPSEDIKLLNSF